MNIYIIGICGTFMGGLARLAREMNMQVSGSDANTYPPMSTQLESLGIELHEGYNEKNVDNDADIIIVGNTISRGNPELEWVLDRGLPYTSGAQWLSESVLQGRWVLAIAGTHGKTTTSSMLAWILHYNELNPGYLIGGVPANFNQSAALGDSPFFVIEADEYDTAFSDKRSKFVHYQPRTLVLNNLEFDHADIFSDLAAIQTQFHHLLKIVPSNGLIIHNTQSPAIDEVLERGHWSDTTSFANETADWKCLKLQSDASHFIITHENRDYTIEWSLIGDHNMHNAIAAIAAAHHAGVTIEHAIEALASFKSVKRRMETIYRDEKVRVFDDFAHHPTAIQLTLDGLRNKVGSEQIIAVLEPRSNTMKSGVHKDHLENALAKADHCMIYADQSVQWDISKLQSERIETFDSTHQLLDGILQRITENKTLTTNILIMSNGGFDNLHQRLTKKLGSNQKKQGA